MPVFKHFFGSRSLKPFAVVSDYIWHAKIRLKKAHLHQIGNSNRPAGGNPLWFRCSWQAYDNTVLCRYSEKINL